MHCGTKLPDEAKFCFSCGASLKGSRVATQSKNSVQLRCKSCNGIMNIDEDRSIMICPFCGSKEIIPEEDKVTVQRIKSNAFKDVEFGKQQIYREVELGKKELELKEDNSKFKQILICFVIILIGVMVTYWSLCNVSIGGLLTGVIVVIAGIVSLKNFSRKKVRKSDDSAKFPRQKTPTTQADVEIAKIKAEERKEKFSVVGTVVYLLIIFLFLWQLCR